MTPAAMLAQADSLANWFGVVGQWVGAIGTIAIAFAALRWNQGEHQRERRDREKEQATRVTIQMGYSPPVVTITNRSEQQVRRLHIESINAPVRWGGRVHELDMDGEEREVGDRYGDSEEYVLQPHMSTSVQYQYFDAHGQTVSTSNFFNERVGVDDVTITFDMSGVRWLLTGNREPVRVCPASSNPGATSTGRAFVADWISRIRRYARHRPD